MAITVKTRGSGSSGWVAGAANATSYPTDGKGGATATATSSALHGATDVLVVGILVTRTSGAGAGAVLSVVDAAGTDVTGLAITVVPTTPKRMFLFGEDGVRYTGNVGIKSSAAAVTGTLIYRNFTNT